MLKQTSMAMKEMRLVKVVCALQCRETLMVAVMMLLLEAQLVVLAARSRLMLACLFQMVCWALLWNSLSFIGMLRLLALQRYFFIFPAFLSLNLTIL
jgi:hypothetical protein